MDPRVAVTPEVRSLIEAVCDGVADDAQLRNLKPLLLADEAARTFYVDLLNLDAELQWLVGSLHAGDAAVEEFIAAKQTSPPSPASTFPTTLFMSTVGYFSEGMPLAYLLATMILGVGLLIGSRIYVSGPEQVAHQSVPLPSPLSPPPSPLPSVGRITGMVDCEWGQGPVLDHRLSTLVSLGDTFTLSSGLLEITYDTGAKVILQGPVTYEVESATGGYLAVGKLTARVEKKANSPLSTLHSPLFAVRTPTAIVTDLGTEFGVWVDAEGRGEAHVLQGAVIVTQYGVKEDGSRKSVQMTEGQAVQIGPHDTTLTAVPYSPNAFIQQVDVRPGLATSGSTAGGAYSRTVLADNPVAYYRLNETVPKTARNAANSSSGSRQKVLDAIHVNFGATGGLANVGQPGPRPTDRCLGRPLLGFEPDNRAPFFDPSALSRLQRANRGAGDPLNITGALSLEAWVYLDGYSNFNQGIVAKWLGNADGVNVDQRSYNLFIDNESPGNPHSVGFGVSSAGSTASMVMLSGRAAQAVPTGEWVHLAATFVPGKSLRIYRNGVLQASQDTGVPAAVYDSTAPLWIGAHYSANLSADSKRLFSNVFFNGRIDEVAIYNYALDDTNGDGIVDADNRVAAHFNAAFEPEPTANGEARSMGAGGQSEDNQLKSAGGSKSTSEAREAEQP